MGHAAYLRGNKVISEQIQRDFKAGRTVRVELYYLETIEEDRERLRTENAALQAQLQRAMLHLRERRATISAERENHAEQTERLLQRAHAGERYMLLYKRRWEWVSRLLRYIASPAQVAEAKTECT